MNINALLRSSMEEVSPDAKFKGLPPAMVVTDNGDASLPEVHDALDSLTQQSCELERLHEVSDALDELALSVESYLPGGLNQSAAYVGQRVIDQLLRPLNLTFKGVGLEHFVPGQSYRGTTLVLEDMHHSQKQLTEHLIGALDRFYDTIVSYSKSVFSASAQGLRAAETLRSKISQVESGVEKVKTFELDIQTQRWLQYDGSVPEGTKLLQLADENARFAEAYFGANGYAQVYFTYADQLLKFIDKLAADPAKLKQVLPEVFKFAVPSPPLLQSAPDNSTSGMKVFESALLLRGVRLHFEQAARPSESGPDGAIDHLHALAQTRFSLPAENHTASMESTTYRALSRADQLGLLGTVIKTYTTMNEFNESAGAKHAEGIRSLVESLKAKTAKLNPTDDAQRQVIRLVQLASSSVMNAYQSMTSLDFALSGIARGLLLLVQHSHQNAE